MNKEELKKYLSEQLGDVDRHKLEKSAQTDPFAYEAMEGFDQLGMSEADLTDLDNRLENRVFEKEKVRVFNWWRISAVAASIGLVIGLLGGWLLFGLKDELKQTEVSQKVETPIESDKASAVKEEVNVAPQLETVSSIEAEKEVAPVADLKEKAVVSNEIKHEAISATQSTEPVEKALRSDNVVSRSVDVAPIETKKASPAVETAKLKTESLPSPSGAIKKDNLGKESAVVNAPKAVIAAEAKTTKPEVIAANKKSKSRTIIKAEEPAYKSAGEEISLGGLADMLKQEQNEVAKERKVDANTAPIINKEPEKKQEVFKYDYDKAENSKPTKTRTEESGREKKSKIKIALDVLPVNITFEDYVKIKLREKAYRCPKKGSVKLFVNLDKDKKIEDFTMLEVNNKVCIDYAKAIVEEWITEKAALYDENRAYQFVINFN
jgi:hypothetical protein